MPKISQPQKPRRDQPVETPEFPILCAGQPLELADLIETFKQGLQAERVYLANCLERSHEDLLARLSESCGISLPAVCPELKREVESSAGGELEMSPRPSGSPVQLIASQKVLDKVQVQRRLQARIGHFTDADLVPADTLYAAAEAISLEEFSLNDIRGLVAELQDEFSDRAHRSARVSKFFSVARTDLYRKPEFSIPFGCLVEVLLKSEGELARLGHEDQDLLIRVRDTLLSSDTNCMVAELLNLRADDVSNKRPKLDMWQVLEPFLAVAIASNALVIGLSTYPNFEDTPGMLAAEFLFTLVFTVELFLRAWSAKNCRAFLCGKGSTWHGLDILIVACGWMDICLRIFFKPGKFISSLSILRLARFSKLIRLIKLTRIKFLSEITLMIHGLVVGARTLFWAVVLLLFAIYAISIFVTMSVGQDERDDDFDRERRDHFSTLGRTAFTTFRCTLVVDCASSSGPSLLLLATHRYGWVASFSYTFVFLIVNIGLMNLIMAVFVDNTMRQAQKQGYKERRQHNRESFRVANQLKKVLTKICKVTYKCHRNDKISKVSDLGIIIDDAVISREDFLLALQDESLQVLLDDLDIPPERAYLFDVLDADGSGRLNATDILEGLLKVRGEVRRSDTAGTFLAIRSLRNEMRGIKATIGENHLKRYECAGQ